MASKVQISFPFLLSLFFVNCIQDGDTGEIYLTLFLVTILNYYLVRYIFTLLFFKDTVINEIAVVIMDNETERQKRIAIELRVRKV